MVRKPRVRLGLLLLAMAPSCRTSPFVADAGVPQESAPRIDNAVQTPEFGGLVPVSRGVAAAMSCCEDWEQSVWGAQTFEIPRLELVSDSPDVRVVESLGSRGVSAEIAETMHASRDLFGPGELESLRIEGGGVVSLYGSGGEGGLFFVGREGEVVTIASDAGYRSLVAAGPSQFFVAVGPQFRRHRIQCWTKEPDGWSSRDVMLDLRSPVLGPNAAEGTAVVVDEEARFSEVRCDGDPTLLHDGDWEILFFSAHEAEAGSRHPCLLPPGLPQSVRRYADGTLAMTNMHHVVVLPLKDDGSRGEHWFGRSSRCNEGRP